MGFDTTHKRPIKGLTVQTPECDVVVPMLALGSFEELQDDIAKLGTTEAEGGPNAQERRDIMLRVVVEAVGRNYPNVTIDDIRDNFTPVDLINAVQAAVGVEEGKTAAVTEPSGAAS